MGDSVKADDLAEMELASLRKLWLILAVIALAFSINVITATQGGALKFGLKAMLGLDFQTDVPLAIIGLWGVICLSLFSFFASVVLIAHSRRAAPNWTERYPFRVFDLPPGLGIGPVIQVLAVVFLTLLPGYTLGHSWRVLSAKIVLCVERTNGVWEPRSTNPKDLFDGGTDGIASDLRLSSDPVQNGDACASGRMTSYYGPVQTWFLIAMTALAFIAMSAAILSLFIFPKSTTLTDSPNYKPAE